MQELSEITAGRRGGTGPHDLEAIYAELKALGPHESLAELGGEHFVPSPDRVRAEAIVDPATREMLELRNSLKLAVKYCRGREFELTRDGYLTSELACETALALSLCNAPQAECLASPFVPVLIADPEIRDKLLYDVERKFGRSSRQVLDDIHVALAQIRAGSLPEEGILRHPNAAAMAVYCCARLPGQFNLDLDRIDDDLANAGVRDDLRRLVRRGIRESHDESFHFGRHLDGDFPMGSGIEANVNALRIAAELYRNITRNFGPEEQLPMLHHASEVGHILARAGASSAMVSAGILHDAREGYSIVPLSKIDRVVEGQCGAEALRIVRAVTEPPKTDEPQNWIDRKISVVRKVQDNGVEAATVHCASKASTFAAGNRMLYSGYPIEKWSAANLRDNVDVAVLTALMYESLGVHELPRRQYLLELGRMAGHLRVA